MREFALGLCLASAGGMTAQEPDAPPPGLEQLRLLGEIELSANRLAPSPIGEVVTFAVDPQGRIACLRIGDPCVLVVLDGVTGALLAEIPVAHSGWGSSLAFPDPDHVLVSGGRFEEEPVLFSSVNLTTKEVAQVSNGAAALDSDDWRGATWLGSNRLVTWEPDILRCWTTDGKIAWTLTPSDRLANVDSVCTTTNGRLAILDRQGEEGVQFVFPEGRVGPYFHLKEVWNDEGASPHDVHPAEDGGLWVVDWDEDGKRLVRVDPHCRPLQEWIPRYPDGAHLYGDVAVAPTGDVWVRDDTAFVRLGGNGVVDRVIGESRESASLRDASMVRIGPDGSIYAASERDHSVHVFDGEGHETRVRRPTGFAEDGRTPIGLGELEWVEKRWYPVGKSSMRWEVEEHVVRLVDPALGQIRVHAHTDFAESESMFEGAATSPDGALAVTLFRGFDAGHELLHVVILDPDQEKGRKVTLPERFEWLSSISFDGNRIALANSQVLCLFDRDSRSILKANFPNRLPGCGMSPDFSARVDFARGGTELWIREGDFGTTIRRHALP